MLFQGVWKTQSFDRELRQLFNFYLAELNILKHCSAELVLLDNNLVYMLWSNHHII